MKNNPGKFVLFLLFLTLKLSAASKLADYTLTASTTDAYIKEAVTITFVAKQKEHSNVMFFFLEPHKSKEYDIKLLSKKTTELSYHNFTTTFTYILFPLKAKTLHVNFDFTIKEASDQAVAQVYTGSRDNVKWIETEDTKVPLKPLVLHVKPLKEDVSLVGEFKLESKINKTRISQYESANLLYTLHGRGYKESNLTLLPPIDDVAVFSELHDAFSKLTTQGYVIKQDYIYALSSKKSFQIPAVKLRAFSPKREKYYTLQAPAYDIDVEKIDTQTLLDDEEAPTTQPLIPFETLKEFFIYILVFLSGYLTALYLPKEFPKRGEKEFADIYSTQSPKELLTLLSQRYLSTKLQDEMELLEKMVYHNEKHSFSKIKKVIIAKLKSKGI